MQNWQERISINPKICHGKPCIKDTRIMVSVILDNLVEGLTFEEIVQEYPPLNLEDIRAEDCLCGAINQGRRIAAAKMSKISVKLDENMSQTPDGATKYAERVEM